MLYISWSGLLALIGICEKPIELEPTGITLISAIDLVVLSLIPPYPEIGSDIWRK